MNEQGKLVYKALYKRAERLNKWEYSKQVKRNKGKKLKTFTPNEVSLLLIEAMNEMNNGKRKPQEAMSVLYLAAVRAETRECMEAGF